MQHLLVYLLPLLLLGLEQVPEVSAFTGGLPVGLPVIGLVLVFLHGMMQGDDNGIQGGVVAVAVSLLVLVIPVIILRIATGQQPDVGLIVGTIRSVMGV